MSRTLATIRVIKEVLPIEDADNIELILVDGWQVVSRVGEFKKDDLCIYCEIDSVLPDGEEWAEFMRPRKFRVKTVKLRKQISQGLALPMSILPPDIYSIDTDVTELLGVTKYLSKAEQIDNTIGRRGSRVPHAWMLRFYLTRQLHYWIWPNKKGGWPEFVPKTDETRVQNIRNLEKLIVGKGEEL